MTYSNDSNLLRRALLADAVATGATALLLVVGADLLAPVLALPVALLRFAGLALVPFVAVLIWLLGRRPMPRGIVSAVVAVNALWAVDSIALLFTGLVAPNALGYAFVIAQALVVTGFAEWQYVGLRRARAPAAAAAE